MRLCRLAFMALACALLWAPVARADKIGDEIDKAAAAWKAHDEQTTLHALDNAANLLRQARADALKALLPVPPAGWTADPPETTAVSGEVLGGGTSASGTYHNGSQQVQVQLTTDSPMLQGMAALINSPLGNTPGVTTDTVAGHRVSYTESDNGYISLVGGTIIVKVNGNKDTPQPILRTFLGTIDFSALEKLAH